MERREEDFMRDPCFPTVAFKLPLDDTSAKLDTYSLFVIRNTVVVIHAKYSIDKSF